MNKKKITIIDYDDWKGVYVEDNLVYEGHSLYWGDVVDILSKHQPFFVVEREVDAEYIEEVGCLPQSLSDLKEFLID